MNKNNKKFIKLVSITLILMMILSVVSMRTALANSDLGSGFNYGNVPSGGTVQFDSQVNKIWNTIEYILWVASFAGILFAGVRYMFASADQKADIKKGTISLVIGMVLVFSATLVIDFIVNVFNSIT